MPGDALESDIVSAVSKMRRVYEIQERRLGWAGGAKVGEEATGGHGMARWMCLWEKVIVSDAQVVSSSFRVLLAMSKSVAVVEVNLDDKHRCIWARTASVYSDIYGYASTP